MEASFQDRVDKAFGSLSTSTTAPEGVTSALWCLTDKEIDSSQWNRRREEPDDDQNAVDRESGPSFEDHRLEDDLNDLSDGAEDDNDDEGENSLEPRRSDSADLDEYLDVRSNIGRDCTLDFEEEEDDYDKVAVGTTEQRSDRLYMKQDDYGIEVNGYGELPNSFRAAVRDPRANHAAALVRLKEDSDDALQKLNDSEAMNIETEELKKPESDSENLRSILKRNEAPIELKPNKRVRFAVNEGEESSGASLVESETVAKDDHGPGVPDYIRNPSRYTRYALDSSEEMDDQSNRKAYMEFFQYLRKGETESVDDTTASEVPKSITFTITPKRRQLDDTASRGHSKEDDHSKNKTSLCAMAEDDSNEVEISAMDEDVPCVPAATATGSGKRGRQYRSRNDSSTSEDE